MFSDRGMIEHCYSTKKRLTVCTNCIEFVYIEYDTFASNLTF